MIDLSNLSQVEPKETYKLDLCGGEDAHWFELRARGPAWLLPIRSWLAKRLMGLSAWLYPWELRETDEKVPVYSIFDWCAEHPIGEYRTNA